MDDYLLNFLLVFSLSIWSLKALDHFVISDEEIIEDIYLKGVFSALSASFKIQSYIPCPKVFLSIYF